MKNEFWRNDFAGIQDLGYYPYYENILLDLQFCEPQHGMNMAIPPESLHVICLGYMPHLVQGLSSGNGNQMQTQWMVLVHESSTKDKVVLNTN